MKFNYTKRFGQQEFEASFDTDIVWGWVFVPESENVEQMLILHTTLSPFDKYEEVPVRNNKGVITSYKERKVTETPAITLFKEDEITSFLEFWNS
jgi:hypothetical protein